MGWTESEKHDPKLRNAFGESFERSIAEHLGLEYKPPKMVKVEKKDWPSCPPQNQKEQK